MAEGGTKYDWSGEQWEYRTKLLDAIREGRSEEALSLFETYEGGKNRLRMSLMKLIDTLFGVVVEQGGQEVVPEVFRRSPYSSPLVEAWEAEVRAGRATWRDFPLEEFIYQRLDVFRHNHDAALGFQEDEEKYVLTLPHCKTGGAMIDQYAGKLSATDVPYQWSVAREDLFHYCVSCPLRWEVDWLNEHGYPLIMFDPPKGPGDPCVQTLYKDPRDIPDEYFERMGVERKYSR
jgi:hypothetical protein